MYPYDDEVTSWSSSCTTVASKNGHMNCKATFWHDGTLRPKCKVKVLHDDTWRARSRICTTVNDQEGYVPAWRSPPTTVIYTANPRSGMMAPEQNTINYRVRVGLRTAVRVPGRGSTGSYSLSSDSVLLSPLPSEAADAAVP